MAVGNASALSTEGFCEALRRFAAALETHRRTIDLLNVYPVPDGDTGTNMTLTLASVCQAMDELPETERQNGAAVCETISKSALMAARGNSGVIISQFLRGMVAVLTQVSGDTSNDISARQLAAALVAGSASADGSVMEPVDGTILSVARDAAKASEQTALESEPANATAQVLYVARRAGQSSLEMTPQQLPVLAEAGVVDAGAVGFLLLLDALSSVVDDKPMPAELDLPPEVVENLSAQDRRPGFSQSASAGSSDWTNDPTAAEPGSAEGLTDRSAELGTRYEVMYLIDSTDEQMNALRQAWATLGDSIVIAGGEGLWNCHIHTDDIAACIEAGIAAGRPHNLSITDLHEQVEHIEQFAANDSFKLLPADPGVCAVVAVSPAPGIDNIFAELGVAAIVSGGQTMNPSTAELLAAVEAVDADQVVLLPNNSNIVAAAARVDESTSKQVEVVPTRNIPQGIATMFNFDPQTIASENATQMAGAEIVAGEITQAVRSTHVGNHAEGIQVEPGDWIGLSDTHPDRIVAVADNAQQAAIQLLATLIEPHHSVLTVIVGKTASTADTESIRQWMAESHPSVEADVLDGGQDHYPYFFGLE